ncbi:type IV toxin-antitoxin system AbiEi family antitoxin domain-containing protein [Candidatus Frankia nodulisporulans]|uniref:type IV toxin-antitoxin system AbiEi family antitoxin domain-containing protein n=1 Tax=Candidatus Frankia nodulisporulans TaxID=2060052 RepID=UPI0030B82700
MTSLSSALTSPTRPVTFSYPGLGPALRLARSQGGMITFRQAIEAGLTRGQLRRLVLSGQWDHPVRGAFVVLAVSAVPVPRRALASAPRPGPVASAADLATLPGSNPRPAAGSGSDLAGLAGGEGAAAAAELLGLPSTVQALSARVRAALVGRPQAVACSVTAARLLGFPAAGLTAAGTVPSGVSASVAGFFGTAPCDAAEFGSPALGMSPFEAGPGANVDDARQPVHLMLPARLTRAQPRGVRLHFTDLPPADRIVHSGIPLTSTARTLADLVLTAPNREVAVAIMDGALHSGVVTDLRAARLSAAGRRGYRRALPWWSLADRRAQSPLETRLRLLFADAGLAPPRPQWPVSDAAGQVVTQLDLAWPAQRVAVEAEGAMVGRAAGVVHGQRQRANLLAAMNWTVLRFGDLEVAWYPQRVVETVAQCLARATQVGLRAS